MVHQHSFINSWIGSRLRSQTGGVCFRIHVHSFGKFIYDLSTKLLFCNQYRVDELQTSKENIKKQKLYMYKVPNGAHVKQLMQISICSFVHAQRKEEIDMI